MLVSSLPWRDRSGKSGVTILDASPIKWSSAIDCFAALGVATVTRGQGQHFPASVDFARSKCVPALWLRNTSLEV